MEKLLTVRQAAEKLQIKPNTLQIWRNRGKGPSYVKAGGRIRYRERDIDAWLNASFCNPADKLKPEGEAAKPEIKARRREAVSALDL